MTTVCRKRKNICSATQTKIQSVLLRKHTVIGNSKARNTCGTQVEDAWECSTSQTIAELTTILQKFRNKEYTLEKAKDIYKQIIEHRLNQLKHPYNYSGFIQTEVNDLLTYQRLLNDYWDQTIKGEPLPPEDKSNLVKIMRNIKKLSRLVLLAHNDKKTLDNLWNLAGLVLSHDTDVKKDLMEEKNLEKEIARKKAKTKK